MLDATYQLAINFEIAKAQDGFHIRTLKGNKTESFAPASLPI